MKKIAMCIPTYNRPNMVERVLRTAAKQYAKYHLDIYYYDASDTDETKKIIEKYQTENRNIYYVNYPLEDESNDKRLTWIYTGVGMKDSYDYMWLVRDRQRFLDSTLDAVFVATESEPDVIFLGTTVRNPDLFNPRESYDTTPIELYRDWGWRATAMEAVIISVPTMIGRNITEEEYLHIYENIYGYNSPWLHYIWLFHRLAAMPDATIRVLMGEDAGSVQYNLGKSGWNRRVLEVFKDNWIQANERLPQIYNAYKSKVIKEGASLPGILGTVYTVREMYQTNILTKDNLESALLDWERVSDVPPRIVSDIVYDMDECHDVSILFGKRGTVVDMLIKLIEMIREGKITLEQVPFDHIETYMRRALPLMYKAPMEERVLVEGMLNDINHHMQSEEINEEHMQFILQSLLVVFSLMENR